MGVPDCGAVVVMPGKGDPAPVVVTFDGKVVRSETRPLPREGLRVPAPACGVHTVDVRWGASGPWPHVAVFGPEVTLTALSFWPWSAAPRATTACLTLDPPTFGWSCGSRTVPPDAPLDLLRCPSGGAGLEPLLRAEAMNQPPLTVTLVPTRDGHYTASVKDRAIVVSWEADTSACAGMERPTGPSWPAVAPAPAVTPGGAVTPPSPPASEPAPTSEPSPPTPPGAPSPASPPASPPPNP